MSTARRAALLLVLGGLGVLVFRITSDRDVITTLQGPTMGTSYTVRIAADLSDADQLFVQTSIEVALDRVDESMSTWRDDSELSQFNASRSTAPREASDDLLAVLEVAQRVSRASGGAFDVTVGPLVDAWGFGPSRGERAFAPPDEATLERLQASTGWELLVVDREAGTVAKRHPDVQVDLSAVAKGYGVDLVAAAIEEWGFEDYVVEIGGEVVARGDRYGASWRVGIAWPEPGQGRLWGEVGLDDVALATSGGYQNFVEYEGRVYSHTIDPRTGRPVTHGLVSVSVIADTCAEADAWATALTVLGEEAGYELAEELGLAALFIWRGEDGELEDRVTAGFGVVPW